jgi:segregation and condensation protein B
MLEQNHSNQSSQAKDQERAGLKSQKADSGSTDLDEESLKRVIEALIFASDKPLAARQIKDIIGDVDTRVIRKFVNDLKQEYSDSQRSFDIIEVAGGFQFVTDPVYGRWLKKLYNIKQSNYLSAPSLETIAIIAYRQPVTKADIESVRGVNVDGVISSLQQKGFVRIVGKKDVAGKPFLYGTTALFLQYFGLNSIEELPVLPEFRAADLEFQKTESSNLISLNKDYASTKMEKENEKTKSPAQQDRQD